MGIDQRTANIRGQTCQIGPTLIREHGALTSRPAGAPRIPMDFEPEEADGDRRGKSAPSAARRQRKLNRPERLSPRIARPGARAAAAVRANLCHHALRRAGPSSPPAPSAGSPRQ